MPISTPSSPERVSPRDIARSGLCIGCGSCASSAPDGAMAWDRYGQLKPAGSAAFLRERTEAFTATCPFSPHALDEDQIAAALYSEAPAADPLIGRHEACYVGHAEEDFRPQGSSGGMVSWVAAELLRRGLVDGIAHVVPTDPGTGAFFRYRISRSAAEVREGAKSRYYPIDLSAVLAEIRATPGRYAIVGIPCFIKAVNLLRANDPLIAERVPFTLGLFCGHMKSAHFVQSFAWQLDTEMSRVKAVDYRRKDPGRPANWYTAHLSLDDGSARWQDWWHLADGDWGAGFFMNSACNWCDDVVAETADVAFGDAWVEPYSSDGRGTNVVITRSPVIEAMIREGMDERRLSLEQVDAAFIEATQAAGFRQRREGLAWRLARRSRLEGVMPVKRVAPGTPGLPARRRLVYWLRAAITRWSHRTMFVARLFEWPRLYTGFARGALAVYQGVTYSRGWIGRVADRWLPKS